MKILHLPANVSGNAYGLIQGERNLGLDSKLLSVKKSSYQFPGDPEVKHSKNILGKLVHRIRSITQVRTNYDVYHFNFGASLIHSLGHNINLVDLPLYSRKAVKVVTYQGCDARQKYPTIERVKNQKTSHTACFYEHCANGLCNSGKMDIRRRKAIDKMMHYCQHAFALNPDLLYFLPQEKSSFLPYTIPNFDQIPEKSLCYFSNDKINIVHAPTQRVTKGTAFILEAIEQLQNKYPNKINFELIENTSYTKALELYQKADLFIDQVLVGWYGGVAVEVMKMGIPVATYVNENDLELIPKDFSQSLPIIKVTKDNIFNELCYFVENREALLIIGQKSKEFVNKWHHPNYVASLTKNIYLEKLGFIS